MNTFEILESRTLLAAGLIDNSYNPPFNQTPSRSFPHPIIHMQNNGKSIHAAELNGQHTLWRQNPNGSLDTSFGSDGKVILEDHFVDFAVAPDGKIVVDYADRPDQERDSIHVARFTANGKPDLSFGGDGDVMFNANTRSYLSTSVAVANDGKIILGGQMVDSPGGDAPLYRLNANGTLDRSFGTDGEVRLVSSTNGHISDIDIRRSDNRIVAIGHDSNNWKVWVVAPNGNVEWTGNLTVNLSNIAHSFAEQLVVAGDGSLIVGGEVSNVVDDSGSPRQDTYGVLARYPAPRANEQYAYKLDEGRPLAVDAAGRIIIAIDTQVKRLKPDLNLDNSFGTSGKTDIGFGPLGVALQPDGKMIIDGIDTTARTVLRQARLTGDDAPPPPSNPGAPGKPAKPANAKFSRGRLRIRGTTGADDIRLSKKRGFVRVFSNGTQDRFKAAKVKRISIDTGDGNDTIKLTRNLPKVNIDGGNGQDTLIGARRKDVLDSVEDA